MQSNGGIIGLHQAADQAAVNYLEQAGFSSEGLPIGLLINGVPFLALGLLAMTTTLSDSGYESIVYDPGALWSDDFTQANYNNEDLVDKICFYVQDLAAISSEGLSPSERETFVNIYYIH